MRQVLSGAVLSLILCGFWAAAQQPHVTQTLPSATVKLNGASGGGGSGTGFTYDAGDLQWLFEPPSGADRVMIRTDSMNFNDAADETLMQILPAAAASGSGVTTYVAGRLAADAIEVRGSSSLAASGTITATNVTCSTGGGAVVGTLNATAGNVGRFVYVTRDGANTCTIGVASGQTLDGVTDGTTTVPSAGWKTFVQTTSTAWVTAGSYPVTGTLSGLTAPFLPVAASATTVANSDLSYFVGKWTAGESVNGRKLCFTDSTPLTTCLVTSAAIAGQGFVIQKSAAEGAALGELVVGVLRPEYVQASYQVQAGSSAGLFGSGYAGGIVAAVALANGEQIGWPIGDVPDTQIAKDANGVVGIYGSGSTYGQLNVGTIQQSYSKALVDATATDVVQVPVASNSYEGFTMDYTIFATDATDYQVRQGSVPVAVLNVGGTETCVFGTATEAVNASTGTLTVAFDCTAGTNTVMVRANANTSLASTTVFTIQQRINLTSGTAVLVPQ